MCRPGQLIVALLALRIIWRFIEPPPPPEASPAGPWADRAAKFAHVLLYVLLIAAPAAGVVTLFADGKPLPLFGLGEIASPWIKDKALEHSAKEVHEWLANGLIVLAAASRKRGARASLPAARRRAEADAAAMDRRVK